MLLSDKLKQVCFTEIEDPMKYFDQLAHEAKELESISSIHSILIEELGQSTVENALKSYFNKK
ncbi:hypothetical protein [Enterococcus wangshanyuanii]|uniref:Uncharacterized protein n=1 Tax=Enterococcus wangshanyuanii TaxID=2005703 RepID=A0ABQ1PTG4_9ENTE|nr:hypothetical protein [Enterococcus wangshanyuanii]GGD03578.1 hypothetical protein GCM10011573_36310 [Enterococcus wangshanyuanii]